MLTRIKMAVATALVLGTASVALAGSEDTEDRGGFVIPVGMVGVNPVYHPDISGNAAVAKAFGFVHRTDHTWHVRSTW